ncbi:MAG TPA: FHA domain-containing protein [Stenomitos sp.]
MNRQNADGSHVLVIYDQPEPRQILLKSATYSIGRDKLNAIVIPHAAISRQHALLLRMPVPERNTYRYRLLDGNVSGKPSLNGLMVNGTRCSMWDLQPGDSIVLGEAIRVEYKIMQVPNNVRYHDYLKIQTPAYQSLKTAPVSASATLCDVPALGQMATSAELEALCLDDYDDNPPTELFKGNH